ncbi:MAG: twin-arginine translocase TatA/TatE family subunit [Methylobacterium sp.]|jgi:sec-independent protein translocase protein TatA|uniref:twin-arginine translocase TatA/TatE family subunit n=1 Tax=Rhabdaerophilum sp. TaxID=2717341 RepID=UPI0022BFCC43|nr:twin-arginine translocase TatA/TatE family subunit [Methylobacterium sp.]MCE2932910.1 twin-arginine translocase TatA/TatE family subunit [Hyphomicrobiales bacterium]MCZ8271150.1 twin-arginine translocase TatA/TatE family subunit [Beijerinckiaceae bacterium]MCA3626894.1 twin-arginine translocase TatA/TatE family subunit [Methylobacterium sp.]MCA3633484.1 twin-arginine translocase TatA/TatE family subunit [Methylobacterium sp.]
MGSMSIWHWLIVAVVVLLLFGRGKIPELMGDVAKGIKNFKAGMKEDEQAAAEKAKELEAKAAETVQTQTPASQPPKAS